jgi:hypothetical protein
VSVSQNAVQVAAAGVPIAGTIAVTSPTMLTFMPSSTLAASTTYTVTASGFTDLAANTVTPFTSTFTTQSSSSGQLRIRHGGGEEPAIAAAECDHLASANCHASLP